MWTYAKAAEFLGKRDVKSTKQRGTKFRRMSDGTIAVYYHATPIVTYRPDGSYVLKTNGYRTSTTKSRINEYSPAYICQRKFVWYQRGQRFVDGMILNADGQTV